jgi:membrane protein required for colicin V production
VLTWADIALLVILGLSTLVGLWRGFVVEVMSLAVWIAAFWLAFVYGDAVAPLFDSWVASPSARLLLGYALLFAAALAVGGLATWLMGKLVRSTGLSGTDRLLGLLFGAARGYALAALAVLLAGFTALPGDPWWEQSRVLPAFQRGAEWLRTHLPESVAQEVNFVPVIELKLPRPGESAQVPADAR